LVGVLKVNDENSRILANPLVIGMDPWIRIHTKISWIRNTARRYAPFGYKANPELGLDTRFQKHKGYEY
jgi:hypothetical protein